MFEFTIKENELLNEFKKLFDNYVSKSYVFTMKFLSNPTLAQYRDNERLALIVVNKSVYQNLYSFVKLNDSNMQLAAFSCLEAAVNSMRLYSVLVSNPKYLHDFITDSEFSLENVEKEIDDNRNEYDHSLEEFSLKEFSSGLHMLNTFELKNSSIGSHIFDNNIYLGISCGKSISDALQDEVRKNYVGAYLSLQKHAKMFFNGGIDNELEGLEDELYAKFLEYVKKFS